MAYAPIPKDLSNIKIKVMLNLTKSGSFLVALAFTGKTHLATAIAAT